MIEKTRTGNSANKRRQGMLRALRKAGKGETDLAMRRIEAGVDPEVVFSQVCPGFGVDQESLTKRRSLADARLVAAKLLKEVTGLTQR